MRGENDRRPTFLSLEVRPVSSFSPQRGEGLRMRGVNYIRPTFLSLEVHGKVKGPRVHGEPPFDFRMHWDHESKDASRRCESVVERGGRDTAFKLRVSLNGLTSCPSPRQGKSDVAPRLPLYCKTSRQFGWFMGIAGRSAYFSFLAFVTNPFAFIAAFA